MSQQLRLSAEYQLERITASCDSTIGVLERHDASKTTEFDAVKAKLAQVRVELEGAILRSSTRVTSAGQPSGMQKSW